MLDFCQNMEKCCARYGSGGAIPDYCGELIIGCISCWSFSEIATVLAAEMDDYCL